MQHSGYQESWRYQESPKNGFQIKLGPSLIFPTMQRSVQKLVGAMAMDTSANQNVGLKVNVGLVDRPNVVVKERQACSLPLPVRIAVHRVTPTHASKATIWQKRRKESKSRKDLEQLEKDLRRKEITLQRIEREIEDFKLPKKETRAMAIITRKPKKNTKIRNRKISTRPCSNIYQHDSFKQRCMLNFYHCCCKFYCYLTILLIAAGFVLFVI
ncbi:unnamed protein product [Arctia plantaginis]|uniref:Uncharacterized protein n=1 Tax=Arctia plantaginis TaxID=874455 RepID=A0A8S1BAV2_ARCPL|nr:unnamed protein product [Arctia plantaginis]CAB3254923.1 unnamed protein product [Arctia plantaginis]